MSQQDKTVAAILYGVLFVVILKLAQAILLYLIPSFASAHEYAVIAAASMIGVLVAAAVVAWCFPGFFRKE